MYDVNLKIGWRKNNNIYRSHLVARVLYTDIELSSRYYHQSDVESEGCLTSDAANSSLSLSLVKSLSILTYFATDFELLESRANSNVVDSTTIDRWLQTQRTTLWADWDVTDENERALAASWFMAAVNSLNEFVDNADQ